MAKTKKVKEVVKQPIHTDGDPPVCPSGYYWNGTRCVKNVGG
jgi:hypothetical protein